MIMKKTLFTLFVFCTFSSLIYIILLFVHSYFIPKAFGGNVFKYDESYDYALSRLKEADTTTNVDVLIIGSSHAYRGYDVRLFQARGLKAFNLGTSSQTLLQTRYLVQKYIDKLRPKLILLDIYPSILNNDGLESTLQLLSISKPDSSLSNMALHSGDIKAYNSLLYYSIRNNPSLFQFKLKDKPSKENTYVKGGFVENNSVGKIFEQKKTRIIFSTEQHKCLEDIIYEFKKRKIDYFIFQSPIAKTRYTSIINNAEIDRELRSFGKYYNFNSDHSLNDNCFIDDHHINSMGVKIYDKYVLDRILNMFKQSGRN